MQVSTSTQSEQRPDSVCSLGKVRLNSAESGFDVWKKVSLRDNQEEVGALIMARQNAIEVRSRRRASPITHVPNGISMDETMQSSAALGPGIFDFGKRRKSWSLFSRTPFMLAIRPIDNHGRKDRHNRIYPADLVARAAPVATCSCNPSIRRIFSISAGSLHGRGGGACVLEPSQPSSF